MGLLWEEERAEWAREKLRYEELVKDQTNQIARLVELRDDLTNQVRAVRCEQQDHDSARVAAEKAMLAMRAERDSVLERLPGAEARAKEAEDRLHRTSTDLKWFRQELQRAHTATSASPIYIPQVDAAAMATSIISAHAILKAQNEAMRQDHGVALQQALEQGRQDGEMRLKNAMATNAQLYEKLNALMEQLSEQPSEKLKQEHNALADALTGVLFWQNTRGYNRATAVWNAHELLGRLEKRPAAPTRPTRPDEDEDES